MKEERYLQIREYLKENGFARVSALAKLLYVSEPTVRRDLAHMEKEGWIRRNHGGAQAGDDHGFIPVGFRQGFKTKEKKQMAEEAIKFVHPGDFVFLSSSTSCMPLIPLLRDIGSVHIVTNGIETVLLAYQNGIDAICTGGNLLTSEPALAGEACYDCIGRFHYDVAFFSTSGIDEKGTVYEVSEGQSLVVKKAVSQSERAVFLCQKEKWNRHAPYLVLHASEYDTVICDVALPFSDKALLKKLIVCN